MRRVAGVLPCAALLAGMCVAGAARAQETAEVQVQVQAQPAETSAQAPRVVLLPSTSAGVDPLVGRFVDRALQRVSEARGYAVSLDAPQARAPSLLVMWNRVHQLRGEHALHASVGARDGQYVVTLRIASRDGSGPRHGEITAGQRELEASVARWVEATLPAPALRAQPLAAPSATPTPTHAPVPAATPAPPPTVQPPKAEPRNADRDEPSFRLSLRDELVLGLGEDDFLGVLVGPGADYRLGGALWLGLRFAYANLPGREQRAEASLWYLQLEQRAALSARLAVPLRLGLGYLAANGSVLRLSSGIAIDAGHGVGVSLDLLAPTFWVTPDRTLFSMDLGLEASLSF